MPNVTFTHEQLSALPEYWTKLQAHLGMGLPMNSAKNRAIAWYNARPNTTIQKLQVANNANAQVQPAPIQWEPVAAPQVDVDTLLNGNGFDMAIDAVKRKKVVKGPDGEVLMRMQDVYSYPNLNLRKQDSIAYEKNLVINNLYEFVTTNGMVGIEIEVENITEGVPFPAYWSSHADGSLRNNGIEFVSVPLQVKQIQGALELLYKNMKAGNQPSFSNRTSVHIHLNCRDMTQDQVHCLTLLYAIFEKHFYSFAGTKRANSIYCVPLWRCNLLKYARDVIYSFNPSRWHKYCGINLLPLIDNNGNRGYGTVEFRHLYGTDSVHSILEWINMILCLRKAALEMSLKDLMEEIKSMNTTSSYLHLFARVFPNHKPAVTDKDFEECVSNIKRELFDTMYVDKVKRSPDSKYWELARKFGIRG